MNKILEFFVSVFPFSEKYITDIKARTELLLCIGLVTNVGFAVYNLCTGFLYRSVWFGGVAVYYIMLCLIKFFLIIRGFSEKTSRKKYHDLLICGIMLLILNLTVSVLISQMIWQNKSHFYENSVIVVAAVYTVIRIFAATYDSISLKRHNTPALYASKALSLSVALMSLFSLQTSILDRFITHFGARRFINILTGLAVCAMELIIAIRVILWANKRQNKS